MKKHSTRLLISVIIPIYNVEKYLDRCIESVVHQSYKNIEIILVDDGSTDKSGSICDQWAKKDKRIQVIHKKNEGLNYARKDGFLKSSGEYVTFLDSDDYFHPDNIKKSLKVLLDAEADVAIYASKEFSDHDSMDDILDINEDHDIKVLESKDEIACYAFFGDGNLPGVQYMTVWGKLYARNVVNKVDWGVANYRVYEDNFWTPQVFLKANKIVITSSSLIFYRRNVTYGASGNNLGNRMTGNSINGTPVGYIEFVELLRSFNHKLAHENKLEDTLGEKIDKHALLGKTWRIDNLVKAGLLDSENNIKYVLDVLPEFIEAKNKHIDNLNDSIQYLDKNLVESNQQLAELAAEYDRLSKTTEELLGIKRSARLLAGNIKRKLTRPRN